MSFCAVVSSLLASVGVFPTKAMSFQLLGKVTVLSVAFAASIVFSIASLGYIPASFAQALVSTGGREGVQPQRWNVGKRAAGMRACAMRHMIDLPHYMMQCQRWKHACPSSWPHGSDAS